MQSEDQQLPEEVAKVLRDVNDHREDGEKVAAFYNALKANIDDDGTAAIELTQTWIYAMFGTSDEEEEPETS